MSRAINAETEMCPVFRTGRPTNFKLGTWKEYTMTRVTDTRGDFRVRHVVR